MQPFTWEHRYHCRMSRICACTVLSRLTSIMIAKPTRGSQNLSAAATPLIAVKDCSIVLDGRAVLDNVNFCLRAGERWALIGPNGSGKTLLLKLLRGDMWPTPTGREYREYFFDGEVSEQPFGVKERIAYVGPERQDKYVRYEWNHSVTQVVTTGLFDEDIPRTQPAARQRRRVANLLRQFGLWSLRRRGFLTLSYGQRRRTLVARAFASQPQVLLLDEVFNGLDATSARILRKVLQRTRGVGSTWILTTHREHDVPSNVTHAARMKQGRVVFAERRSRTISPLTGVGRGESDAKRLPEKNRSRQPAPSTGEGTARRSTDAPLIQLRNVDLYRDYRLVLSNVSWTLARREHWGIVGRNGSGKSTLLKLLYGDLHPRLGGIIERDRVPFGTPISEWKRRVGFVSPELQAEYFLARNLEEVVISGRYSSIGLNEEPTNADRRAARQWLKFFGLESLSQRRPRTVSYGQMRLALLARAMINKPELLLLDEPCTGLDPNMRAMVLAVLSRLALQGVQLVMAVHDAADMPACVRRVLAIRGDRKVEEQGR
jgi:molybdate transport system ATP-binding protein